jgi:hypothetical protein
MIEILILTAATMLAALLGWYLRGREESRLHKRIEPVCVLFSVPLDEPGLDIPRRADTRKWQS